MTGVIDGIFGTVLSGATGGKGRRYSFMSINNTFVENSRRMKKRSKGSKIHPTALQLKIRHLPSVIVPKAVELTVIRRMLQGEIMKAEGYVA